MPGSVRTLCSLAAVISATVEQMSADRNGANAVPAQGQQAEDYRSAMVRTADLVRTLTELADRCDAPGNDGGAQTDKARAAAGLMRASAAAGRRLVRSLAPPGLPPGDPSPPSARERADRARHRDVQAAGRDAAAQARDERAAKRDVRERAVTGDGDLAFPNRFLAACDRDDAAGDRAEAHDDRRAAHADRVRAERPLPVPAQAPTYALIALLEQRVLVRQAQGVLMDRAGMTADDAFEALLVAATGPLTLDDVANHVLRRAELPALPQHDT